MGTIPKEWEEKFGNWKYAIYLLQIILFFWGAIFLYHTSFLIPYPSSILYPNFLLGVIIFGAPMILTILWFPQSTREKVEPFLWPYYGGIILVVLYFITQFVGQIAQQIAQTIP